jgi:hypothetical protein
VKSGGSLWLRARAVRFILTAFLFATVTGGLGAPVGTGACFAQDSTVADASDSIRGIVVNGVTREPIGRALVVSPDNRFAALTNSEGRFEFSLSKAEGTDQGGSDSGGAGSAGPTGAPVRLSNRPYMLTVRKPGFMPDPNNPGQNLQNDPTSELTLALIPESLIVGTVTLPTSEAPDSISVQLYRRQIQDGRAHWVPAGNAESNSEGQFRFSDLAAGTYKLLTSELLDEDPLAIDPLTVNPATFESRGPLFGYPPVYYQNATDFGAAAEIQLAAGQTQVVNLSLVKQPYYRVKLPVILPADDSSQNGFGVEVYAHGHKGPGFALGYNNAHHAIEGLLPNGTYTVEASSFGPNAMTGIQTITIKGAPVDGPSVAVAPNASVPVRVKEEFTAADPTGAMSVSINGHTTVVRDARRYLSVVLEPADDFGNGMQFPMRSPRGSADDVLEVPGVAAGSYWVRVQSSRGYAASIRSGNLDLEHQPIYVGVGGAPSPIEITMRDDTAEISGTVEGVAGTSSGSGGSAFGASFATSYSTLSGTSFGATSYAAGGTGAHLYCIPVADSGGQLTEAWVGPEGNFDAQGLAPGAYRLLAFDRVQPELEFRNPESMRAYDAKGPVVRVAGGQKEHVTLQVIATDLSGKQP